MSEVDQARRKTVGEAAEHESQLIASKSRLKPHDSNIHPLRWEDVEVGPTIGYGGFSKVFKCTIKGHGDTTEYALKSLNPSTMLKTKSFRTGAVDLALEGEILSRLSHENVIQLHGVSAMGPLRSYLETERGYFLVLDLLKDTLSSRLEKFRIQKKNGFNTRLKQTNTSLLQRIGSVALGVAKGMECLHENGVVLRDLKPDNVGFDAAGVPKIFDLGFAREVHTLKPKEVAGSLRYMAPEVATGKTTMLVSDVYSFGVLLWELCTLEKPYKHINSREEFMEEVIHDGWRHSTSSIPSNPIRKLIKECWTKDYRKRPNFSKIAKVFRVELSLVPGAKRPIMSKTTSTPSLSTNSLRRMNYWGSSKKGDSPASKGSISSSSKRGLSNSSFGVLRSALSRGGLNKNSSRRSSITEDDLNASATSTKQNSTFSSNPKKATQNPLLSEQDSSELLENALMASRLSRNESLASLIEEEEEDLPLKAKSPKSKNIRKSKSVAPKMHESCPILVIDEDDI